MWMAGERGLKRADIANGASLFSDPQCQTATHPLVTTASPAMTTRNCIPAMRPASGSSFTLQKSLPRTDGRPMSLLPKDVFAPQKREAERRTAHHSCRASMGRHGRGPISGPLAFRRSSAVMRRDFIPDSAWAALPGITGCKREDPLRHQCSEHLAVRHAPDGLIPKPPEG